MTQIETLQAKLRARGITATDGQAEALAIRLAGSVDAYLAQLAENDATAEGYKPPTVAGSDKFSEPMTYALESPVESGLPNQP